jgi:hypothetical protein
MVGTIKVEYLDENIDRFIKFNSYLFPRTLTKGRGGHEKLNGHPVLCAAFHSIEECAQVERTFAALGWLFIDQIKNINNGT